jgi:hypothetical protein
MWLSGHWQLFNHEAAFFGEQKRNRSRRPDGFFEVIGKMECC